MSLFFVLDVTQLRGDFINLGSLSLGSLIRLGFRLLHHDCCCEKKKEKKKNKKKREKKNLVALLFFPSLFTLFSHHSSSFCDFTVGCWSPLPEASGGPPSSSLCFRDFLGSREKRSFNQGDWGKGDTVVPLRM